MKRLNSPIFFCVKGANQNYSRNHSTKNVTGRKFVRSSLPSPKHYYEKEFPGIKINGDWAKTHCCFHDDKIPSLSINMIEGYFRCFACGAKGGDLLSFHRLRYKFSFVEAVNYFGAWEYE